MKDPVQVLEEVLGEADALIRHRLKQRGLEFPHLVVAVAAAVEDSGHGAMSGRAARLIICNVAATGLQTRRS
jgi:hypothetical protein